MSKEIPKPETEENKFDEEENASDLNKIIEEEMEEKKGGKEHGIDTRTGEFLIEQDIKERREKGLER